MSIVLLVATVMLVGFGTYTFMFASRVRKRQLRHFEILWEYERRKFFIDTTGDEEEEE